MTKGLTLQEKLQEQPRKLTPAIVTGGGFKGDITASGLGASPFLKAAIPEDQVSSFGKLEVMKAAFERENTIGSFVASELSGAGQPDPNFDVIDNIRGTKYEPHLNRFKEAFNQNDFDKITRNIDREEDNSELLDNAGAFGIVSMFGASLLDPINLIPIGGEAYKAWRVGKVAKGALRTGTAGLVSTTASEAILQSTQETRTKEESLINIGAGTVLSGILGGAAAKLSKADFDVMAEKMRSDSMSPEAPFDIDPVTQEIVPRSAGAKQVVPYEELYAKYTEETIAKGKEPVTLEAYTNKLESLSAGIGGSAAAIAKSLSKINPLLRVFNSKSLEGRTLLQDLATHNMLVGKNEVGVASQQSVETAVKQWRAGLGEAVPANKKSFLLYKNRVKSEGADSPIKNQVAWNTEVSKAMRRGDTHEIPEVAAAAKEWRSKVFEPLKNGAIETKILPEDVQVETATSYLSRLWNRKAVIANEVELRKIIFTKLKEVELPKLEALRKQELRDLEIKLSRASKKDTKGFAKLEENYNKERIKFDADFGDKDLYSSEITDGILSNLKGETRFGGVSNYDFKITKRGPLKERTLSFIRDEEVEQFLENDIEAIANRYTRIMGTDVELARKFEGDVNLENRLAKVADEYKALAEKAKSDKERVALQKEKQSVLTDLGALRDIMRGTYGTPDNPDALIVRSGRVARQLNYVTKLGGVVVSSIADMTRTVGVHGLGRFSKGLGRAITNSKGMKLNIAEGQKAGNVLERVLHTRLATLAELTDPLNSGQSIFERFMSNVSNLGTKFNGIALWNDVQKGFASVMTQQRMIEEMDNLVKGTIKKNDRTYLAFLGIDADNINMIKKQIDTHSFKEDSLWVANTEKWTDAEAVSIYRNALNQDVDRTIVSKTAGDVPLWMNTELGKVIGQFKSFTFASTQQVLISGLQQADAAALNGFICSASLGMLVYYLKSGIAGRETSEDPRKWIAEGIDRSGYLGIIMEINNISEKVSRGKVGINPLIGGEVMSRYVNRNGLGALMGPSFGLGQDTYQIAGAIATGEITESDVRAFRRNLPFQNIFYIQWLFNDMEKGLNQTLGTE